jgi:hypothetical protein
MSENEGPKSVIILYQTEDGRTRVEVRFDGETVWLTQAQMAASKSLPSPRGRRQSAEGGGAGGEGIRNLFAKGVLDFIINYDIKYRMGRDAEDEEEDE